VSQPDDDTTDFRVGSLRDLLEDEGEGGPPKGGDGKRTRQLAIMAGGAAAVVAVLLAVVLLGGGRDDGASEEGTTQVPVTVRGDRVASNVKKGSFISICKEDGSATAENVRVVERRSQERFGTEMVILEIALEQEDLGKVIDTAEAVADRYVYVLENCPTTGPAGTPEAPPSQPAVPPVTPETVPATTPDTAPAPTDTAPTPPPSG
jgi:hypothetical protein